jgi:hypothetical protein
MLTGKGVKPEKAEKAIAKSSRELVNGEEVQFFAKCNNMRPVTDALVVTNGRIMGLSTGLGFKFKARFDEISEADYDSDAKTVAIATLRGDTMKFKNVDPHDVVAVQGYVESARSQPVPDSVVIALEQAAEDGSHPISGEEEVQRFGNMIAEGTFDMRSVRIFDKGYVRIAAPFQRSKAKFEKLIAIEASTDVAKKTAVGRGVAALATGGINLLGSNKRGDVYLTITTQDTVHVLHEEPPNAMNLRTVKRLESAGRSVIQAHVEDQVTVAPIGSGQRSVADRLRELESLRDEGLISDEEHGTQRDRLLRDL